MRKGITIIAAVLGGMVLASVLLVVLYYFSAFKTLNLMVQTANDGDSISFEGNEIVSKEDFLALQTIAPIDENVSYYVNGGASYKIRKLHGKSISFVCSPHYTAMTGDGEVLQAGNTTPLLVSMEFCDFKWKIVAVSPE